MVGVVGWFGGIRGGVRSLAVCRCGQELEGVWTGTHSKKLTRQESCVHVGGYIFQMSDLVQRSLRDVVNRIISFQPVRSKGSA